MAHARGGGTRTRRRQRAADPTAGITRAGHTGGNAAQQFLSQPRQKASYRRPRNAAHRGERRFDAPGLLVQAMAQPIRAAKVPTMCSSIMAKEQAGHAITGSRICHTFAPNMALAKMARECAIQCYKGGLGALPRDALTASVINRAGMQREIEGRRRSQR